MAVGQVDRQLDLEELDATVQAAIAVGDAGGLHVLGYGEITLVLGWPPDAPTLAVKRLPTLRDRRQLELYEALLHSYTGELAARGVATMPTRLRALEGAGGMHAYLVQPLVPSEALLNHMLRDADPDAGAAHLRVLVDRVASAVDERVGLDAQVANWAVQGDDLVDFDLSTPMLREPDGRHRLDVSLFTSIYPWALRRALMPVAHSVLNDFHDPRTVIVDVASNLVKERLDRWLPPLLEAANERVAPAITEREVRRYFIRDRRLWLLMQQLRRADRAWQRHARRRPYPFLLPPPYSYGPQELPREGNP